MEAPEPTPAPVEEPDPDPVPVGEPDDLMVIEGIGPRLSTVVAAAGFTSFAALADAEEPALREMLVHAGFKTVNPSTWPAQARLAADGKWDELRELQRRIVNGKLT
jgi:predicted flap endonuclease-1-like 5' DNA nuclease